jgi:GxxExxY protein
VPTGALPVFYRGIAIECGYRLDLVVEHSVIVEVKAVSKVLPVHKAQVLTYLKLTGVRPGAAHQLQCRGASIRRLSDREWMRSPLCPLCLCGELF